MGTPYYGAARTPIKMDDRVLAHVKVLVVSKLRRNEPFLLSWVESAENGHGRASVWIHAGADLVFRFDGSRQADLDKELLDSMSSEALGPTGLRVDAVMSAFWGR